MRIQEAADRYVEFRAANRAAPNTVAGIARALRYFCEAAGNIPVGAIDHEHLDEWLLFRSHLSEASLNTDRSALTGFLKWCRVRGYHERGELLMEAVPAVAVPDKQRRRVPMAEFPALLDAAEHPRDRILVALGLFLFLRASEAVALRLKDVDLQSGYVHVTVFKNKTVDDMPISLELDTELRRWLRWYGIHHGPLHEDMLLVPSRLPGGYAPGGGYAHPLHVNPYKVHNTAARTVRAALHLHGWESTRMEGMHTLRRSGARALFDSLTQQGVDGAMRRVQAMLHHKQMITTEHYIGLNIDRAQRDKATRGHRLYPALEGTWLSGESQHATDAARTTLKAV